MDGEPLVDGFQHQKESPGAASKERDHGARATALFARNTIREGSEPDRGGSYQRAAPPMVPRPRIGDCARPVAGIAGSIQRGPSQLTTGVLVTGRPRLG